MRYVLAILLPPVGMLLCGKLFQAILCFILMLTILGWPIASIWAVLVVADFHAERRNERLIDAMGRGGTVEPL